MTIIVLGNAIILIGELCLKKPMDYILPLLIGAAVPILILIINRRFDFLNLGKSHDLSLSKEYFLKKLNAFEKGTAYYSIAHLSITNMSIIFRTLNKENVDIDADTATKMLAQVQKNIEDVYKLTQDAALALPLYTDLQLSDSDDEFSEKYISLLGEINLTANVILLINKKLEIESTPHEIIRLEEVESNQIKKLGKKINDLYELSKIIKSNYKGITTSLRNELRHFDIQTFSRRKFR